LEKELFALAKKFRAAGAGGTDGAGRGEEAGFENGFGAGGQVQAGVAGYGQVNVGVGGYVGGVGVGVIDCH
jgi:hypothetical protein